MGIKLTGSASPQPAPRPDPAPPPAAPEAEFTAAAEQPEPVEPVVDLTPAPELDSPVHLPEAFTPPAPAPMPPLSGTVEEPLHLSEPVVEPPTQRPRRRWGKKTPRAREARPMPGALKRRIIAISLWTVIALLVVAAISTLIRPPSISLDDAVTAAADTYNLTTFPTQQGSDVAQAATAILLTRTPGDRTWQTSLTGLAGEQTIATIAAGGIPPVSNQIIAGPYLVDLDVIDADPTRAFATTGTLLTSSPLSEVGEAGEPTTRWVFLQMPLLASPDGPPIITGPPSPIPAPTWEPPTGVYEFTVDEAQTGDFTTDMEEYLRAWGASDTGVIERYTAPDATAAATTGLAGGYGTARVVSARLQAAPSADPTGERFAEITVDWSTPDGGKARTAYQLTVSQTVDGAWIVHDVQGGAYLD